MMGFPAEITSASFWLFPNHFTYAHTNTHSGLAEAYISAYSATPYETIGENGN